MVAALIQLFLDYCVSSWYGGLPKQLKNKAWCFAVTISAFYPFNGSPRSRRFWRAKTAQLALRYGSCKIFFSDSCFQNSLWNSSWLSLSVFCTSQLYSLTRHSWYGLQLSDIKGPLFGSYLLFIFCNQRLECPASQSERWKIAQRFSWETKATSDAGLLISQSLFLTAIVFIYYFYALLKTEICLAGPWWK